MALGFLRMLGVGVLLVAVAGSAIVGGAVGGGLLAVHLFVSAAERDATVNLAQVFWFAVGAVTGVGLGVLLLLGGAMLLSGYANSSSYDAGDGRDWRT
jgi:hypothetical protein